VLEVASSFLFLSIRALADRASTDLAAMRRAMRGVGYPATLGSGGAIPKRQGAVHRSPGELASVTRPV
jgi:hypothetical protein